MGVRLTDSELFWELDAELRKGGSVSMSGSNFVVKNRRDEPFYGDSLQVAVSRMCESWEEHEMFQMPT